MGEERAEHYSITDPPGWTVPDELKPSILELLRLQRKERKYRWTSAKQKNPKEEGLYLTVCKHKTNGSGPWVDISFFRPSCGWDVAGVGWGETNVTHWMPLPGLPGMGDKGDG